MPVRQGTGGFWSRCDGWGAAEPRKRKRHRGCSQLLAVCTPSNSRASRAVLGQLSPFGSRGSTGNIACGFGRRSVWRTCRRGFSGWGWSAMSRCSRRTTSTSMSCECSRSMAFRSGSRCPGSFAGEARAALGEGDEGIDDIRQGIRDFEATGTQMSRPYNYLALSRALRHADRMDEALEAINVALALVAQYGERRQEADMLRVKAELALSSPALDRDEGHALLRRAIEAARRARHADVGTACHSGPRPRS